MSELVATFPVPLVDSPEANNLVGQVGTITMGEQSEELVLFVNPEVAGECYSLRDLLVVEGYIDSEIQATETAFLRAVKANIITAEIISFENVVAHAQLVRLGNREVIEHENTAHSENPELIVSSMPDNEDERRVDRIFTAEELDRIYPVVSELTVAEKAAGLNRFICGFADVQSDDNTWKTLAFFNQFDSSNNITVEDFLLAHRFAIGDAVGIRNHLFRRLNDPNAPLPLMRITPTYVLGIAMYLRKPVNWRSAYPNETHYPFRPAQPGDIIQLSNV